jgi:hypothetical protein
VQREWTPAQQRQEMGVRLTNCAPEGHLATVFLWRYFRGGVCAVVLPWQFLCGDVSVAVLPWRYFSAAVVKAQQPHLNRKADESGRAA